MWRPHFSNYLRFASVALLAGASLWAQSASSSGNTFSLSSEGATQIDLKTGETIAKNGVARYGDWLIKAELIRYSKQAGTAVATGNVILTRNDIRLIAEKVDFRLNESFASIQNFRVGNGRGFVEGSLLEGDPNNFAFNDASFFPGEPGTFLFKAKAERIALLDQKKFEIDGLGFRLGAIPFPPLPNINYPVDADTNLFDLDVDYSGHIGGMIGTELQLPVTDHLRAGINLALTTKRGILFGPTAEYQFNDNQGNYTFGKLKTGFIDDSLAATDLDVLNRPIDDERYFAEWQHLQRWGEKASISAYGRWWSDSEVTRDFYEDSYEEMESPDSYLEANYNGDDWQLSLFARATPNDFQGMVERLPELKFEYFPTRVAKNWTQQGYVAAAKLRQQQILSFYDSDLSDFVGNQFSSQTVDRLDAYYGLNYDRKLREGVNFSAKAGARSTYHSEDRRIIGYANRLTPDGDIVPDLQNPFWEATDGTRIFGDIGFDLKATAIATKEIENETWNIDAIRHVFEPVLSYRYTPILEGEKNSLFANPFDGPAVANYLTPIDIEDRRDVDFIQESHKIRLAFNNRIQTRHEDYGSRDLARIDFAIDYDLDPMFASSNDFSDFHADLQLNPAPWLDIRAFSRYNFENGDLEEVNSTLTFKDEGYWRLGVGNQHLRRSPLGDGFEQYLAFGDYALSDNLKLFAIARYDERTSTFYEQSIGLLQRALENYAIKYELRIYDGNRREEDFAIRIGIDLFND